MAANADMTHKKNKNTYHLLRALFYQYSFTRFPPIHIRSCNKFSFCQFSFFPFIFLASFYFTFVFLLAGALRLEIVCLSIFFVVHLVSSLFHLCVCARMCVWPCSTVTCMQTKWNKSIISIVINFFFRSSYVCFFTFSILCFFFLRIFIATHKWAIF